MSRKASVTAMSAGTLRGTRTISTAEYQGIREFLERSCGIQLGDSKQYLVLSRLTPLLVDADIASFDDLLRRLNQGADSALRERVIDAMTTNETSWFRDGYPYEFLREALLPEAVRAGTKHLRIWSAACASGQEPYSISMVVEETLSAYRGLGLRVDILGTDISASALAEAKAAVYSDISVARGLSAQRRERFFRPTGDGHWQLMPGIRARVRFRYANLLEDFSHLGRFDLIFCRNVLIYFTQERKRDILVRMARMLAPGGYLFLGSSESLIHGCPEYEAVRRARGVVYRRRS